MFEFDTKVKIEALNFATVMNALECTEHKLDPLFTEFSKNISVGVPLNELDVCGAYVDFFNVDKVKLLQEYDKAYKCFTSLRKTDEIIKRGSPEYPPLLAQTEQAPRFIYIRGKKSLLYETRTVALIGARNATEKAKESTKNLAIKLGQNGITVVSGLAKGIDVSAHLAALESGYNTLAVIGTHLNQYYPSENKEVQLEIEKRGLVISHFSPASKTQRWFFPLRNGVMSGLSLATIIMEASDTSGALKQVDFALKQERQVLIPASVLRMVQITWPAKYVQRGAQVVNRASYVLKILADNNIFKMENISDSLSNKLDDVQGLNNLLNFNNKVEWLDPIVDMS